MLCNSLQSSRFSDVSPIFCADLPTTFLPPVGFLFHALYLSCLVRFSRIFSNSRIIKVVYKKKAFCFQQRRLERTCRRFCERRERVEVAEMPEAGEATLYACFGGCIDFDNPLHVVIEEASSRESSHGPRSATRQTSEAPVRGGDPSEFTFSSGVDTSPSQRAPSSLPRGSQQRPATLVFEGCESGGALPPEKPPVEELYEVSSLSSSSLEPERRNKKKHPEEAVPGCVGGTGATCGPSPSAAGVVRTGCALPFVCQRGGPVPFRR